MVLFTFVMFGTLHTWTCIFKRTYQKEDTTLLNGKQIALHISVPSQGLHSVIIKICVHALTKLVQPWWMAHFA
jgi:hypothetical protein